MSDIDEDLKRRLGQAVPNPPRPLTFDPADKAHRVTTERWKLVATAAAAAAILVTVAGSYVAIAARHHDGLTPPSTSTATTPGLSVLPCATGQVAMSVGFGGTASGQSYQNIILTNKTDSPCTLQGYAPATALDSHGDAAATATRVPYYIFAGSSPPTSPPLLMLEAGEAAFETIIDFGPNETGTGATCVDYQTFRVNAPASTMSTQITVQFHYCGRMDLTPLLPGTGPTRK